MSDSRNDPTIRKGSLLLSALVLTPDAALEAYRARRVGDPKITVEQLKRARDALDAIAFALGSKSSSANWRRLDDAWEVLRKNTPPPQAVELAPAEPKEREPAAPATSEPTPAADVPTGPAPAPPFSPPPMVPVVAPPVAAPAHMPAPPMAPRPVAPASFVEQPPVAPAPIPPPPPSTTFEGAHDARTEQDEVALPFKGGAAQPPRSALADLEPLSAGDLDGTEALGMKLDLGDVLPFDNEPRSLPTLTVEQYASLCAECETYPARRAEVEAKYGIAGGSRSALDASWQGRLAADATLRAQFQELVARYTEWLRHGSP